VVESKKCTVDMQKYKVPGHEVHIIQNKVISIGEHKSPSFNNYKPSQTIFKGFNTINKYSSTRNNTNRFFANQTKWLGDKEFSQKPGPGAYAVGKVKKIIDDKQFNSTASRFEN